MLFSAHPGVSMRAFLGASWAASGGVSILVAPRRGAQTVQPPYDASYSVLSLGSVPGLPTNYGGLTFHPSDSDVLIIGGAANVATGALYSIEVVRGVCNHITGFTGTAALYSEGQYNDGGVVFGPGGVLFYTKYPVNQLGQIEPGSAVNDKVVDLTPLGVAGSVGAINFVPAGFAGAGRDEAGLVQRQHVVHGGLLCGRDGHVQHRLGHPERDHHRVDPRGSSTCRRARRLFTDFANILVSEYSAGAVTTYQIDGSGNPVPASRAVFISG